MTRLYIAGPLFNSHERGYLEQIAHALERAGYSTFLPHRDAGVMTSEMQRGPIFQADLDALNDCAGVVALLSGADHDSGTSAELGYMFALGKPCFGISDDVRRLNNMIWGICGHGTRIARTIDDLVAMVKQEKTLISG
jgi:nucleoside 2-deoxyribosyltransferase